MASLKAFIEPFILMLLGTVAIATFLPAQGSGRACSASSPMLRLSSSSFSTVQSFPGRRSLRASATGDFTCDAVDHLHPVTISGLAIAHLHL
jgi:hypothetical protein